MAKRSVALRHSAFHIPHKLLPNPLHTSLYAEYFYARTRCNKRKDCCKGQNKGIAPGLMVRLYILSVSLDRLGRGTNTYYVAKLHYRI